MKIVGVERADFLGRDGSEVKGYNVHFARPINADKGKGQAVERDYISDNRAKTWGVDLLTLVGKEADVYYTKNGRIASINVKA